jgi:1,4-dihydroxy-2-naphthoate octaprenyltransferase
MVGTLSLTVKPESLIISVISGTVGTALSGLHGPIHWGTYVLTILGKPLAVRVYELLVAGVYGVTSLLIILGQLSAWAFLTLLSLPLAFKLIKRLRTDIPKDADARTAQLNTAFGVLLIIAISMGKFIS